MLTLSRDGKSFGVVDSFLSGIAFVYRFYLMKNYAEEKPVRDVRKFVEKICEHRANKKGPFGAAEVRIMFDHLISKYASLENVPLPEFRTFCLSVFQHKSFCRFSDLQKIKLSDVFFDADYFKIKIQYSKTDQAGRGSWAFVPKTPGGFLDPHMLLCIYFHRMPFEKHKEEVYLFPPLKWDIKTHEYTVVPNKQLRYPAAYKSFKQLLKDSGLDSAKFGIHSPRIGGATDAFYNKVPLHVIDLQGRWKSTKSKFTYLRLDEKRFIKQVQASSSYQ